MSDFVNEKLENFNKTLSNKRVAIIGLEASNISLVDYFKNLGSSVSVFDNRNESKIEPNVIESLNKNNIKYYLGQNCLKNLIGFNYIFRSPNYNFCIAEIQKEVNNGAILTSEIEQVLELSPSHIVGITGSDGTATTSTLVYKLLESEGYKCFLGGNIGMPLLAKIKDMRPEDYVVIELSNVQLIGMKKSPEIAIITNTISNNGNKDYIKCVDNQKNIYLHQKQNDILVINKDDDVTKNFYKDAPGKVRFFSNKEVLDNGVIFDEKDKIIKICEDGVRKHIIKQKDILLKGEHSCECVCSAISATLGLVKQDNVISTIRNFEV